MIYQDSLDFAASLDREDPLASLRGQFNFPRDRNGFSPVYLCGNSLGLQPRLAIDFVQSELEKWKDLAVDGHFHSERPWVSYHQDRKSVV